MVGLADVSLQFHFPLEYKMYFFSFFYCIKGVWCVLLHLGVLFTKTPRNLLICKVRTAISSCIILLTKSLRAAIKKTQKKVEYLLTMFIKKLKVYTHTHSFNIKKKLQENSLKNNAKPLFFFRCWML